MFDAYINAFNSTLNFNEIIKHRQDDLLNLNTLGYKQRNLHLADTSFGTILKEGQTRIQDVPQPIFMKGEKMTKIAIDPKHSSAFFTVENNDKKYLTRLGAFKYTRKLRAKDTYIGKSLEERLYLTTEDGHHVMGYPIGKGPLKQDKRFKDPFSDAHHPRLGESLVYEEGKTIGKGTKFEYGKSIPIDLTRDSNGLILGKYTEVKTSKDGIIRGSKDGLWVPLYKLAITSVPNPEGLTQVNNTPYYVTTEASGQAHTKPLNIKVRPEAVEKSNVNTKITTYDYKRYRLSLQTALSLQRANQQLLQQFQQLLQG